MSPTHFCFSFGIIASLLTSTVSFARTEDTQPEKTVATEFTPAFSSFQHWLTVRLAHFSEPAAAQRPVMLGHTTSTDGKSYQPAPVILGLPDLPLIGTRDNNSDWGAALNYQGVHMQLVVLDSRGLQRQLRPLSAAIGPNEHFKIRITPTFDAISDIGQIVGDPWYGTQTGQVYPPAGISVQIKAGNTVELPIGENEYFALDRRPDERLLLSVRHAQALRTARSEQPIYRQDGLNGSSYLQLVPRRSYPAFEQIISQRN